MKNQPDIVYLHQGLFTAFIPMSKDGENVCNELAKELGIQML